MGRGRRTVTVHHVRAALRGAQRLGLDTVPLLQRARIPPLLLTDDRARVSPEQFARLVRALHRATGDEFLGLGTIRSRPGTFAMMCYASLGCPDLGTAVERGARFYRLFPGGPNLALERGAGHGREAVLALRGGLGPHADGLTAAEHHIVAEWLMLIWHRLAGWLIGRRIPLLWAQFAYLPPPYADDYEPLFGCPPRFGAPRTAAGFDRRWLTAPVVQDESTLQTLLRHAPAGLLSRRAYGTTVAEQVRHALTGALRARGGRAMSPRGRRTARLPELPEVAARLAVSPATLRRRLREEGTSFQELKDTVRRDEAVSSLAEGGEPIADLAARLGFSEDTAFHRAFRRWTGSTPGAFRHETWSQQI
ncbi:AraC family transcriptional regulator [Streptomyces sp. 11-1-2]|uniref:AraC family transcriptional regulator n=1 Tax=unclassified Streptomyces TaxID=2593676 RepID=UPI000B8D7C4B|nr:AraC family transcriptional regulator [Streptomyces sp. 11-1-2]ASQ96192.1 AraC family transcriptional regulator [Streptomyces sp. 11-1-2]